MRRLSGLIACLLVVVWSDATAQGYRLRVDARAQSVSFRGLTPDSVLATEVVSDPAGGLTTSAGIAVRCSGGVYCYFFRPGPERQGVPVAGTASLVMWGLRVPGLTLHTTARFVTDLGDGNPWPGTEPAVQLLEGYLEYARDWFTGRGGRQLVSSRLEPLGFDGAWLRGRWTRYDLEAAAYGGWGLGQAAVVPITSPVLNPLDEWRPRDRQIVVGAELGWFPGPVDMRAEYRREIEPETGDYVSERTALSLTARPRRFLQARGGIDYNIAEGNLGNADLSVTYLQPGWNVTAGGRRYRPYFSLWTLWGAFSPVPYNAVHGSAELQVREWITLRGRAERFWYEDAEVTTPLVVVEDRGWRVSTGATVLPRPRWTVDGSYLAEFAPGASSRAFDATVTFQSSERLGFTAYGGILERPLELRFYDAETWWLGGRVDWRANRQWRAWADAGWFNEERDRPDPTGASFDQVRLRGGVTVSLGSDADRTPLPPARRSRP